MILPGRILTGFKAERKTVKKGETTELDQVVNINVVFEDNIWSI